MMITLQEFFEAGRYRVNSGSDYGWNCYGNNAYIIDLQAGANFDSNSASIVFDRNSQEVFEVSVCDDKNSRAYRVINPDFAAAYQTESKRRKVSSTEAWEGVDYVDLETQEDFLAKMTAIMCNKDYDTKISVPVDLEDDVLHSLMLMAHEADLTLNAYVEQILREELAKPEYQKPKSWTVSLEQSPEDPDELILPFPEDLLKLKGWVEGDTLEWIDLKNGTWEIKKK